MSLPFNIKFTIFDENKPLTQKQINIRNNLIDSNNIDNDMKKILKNIINLYSYQSFDFKFLDRIEPSISSIDEKKQLRMNLTFLLNDKYTHSLHFSQKHSQSKEYFSLEELKNISNRIKNELEEYLHYEIDTPILYIEIDDL
jgi:hypothetical protein